MKIHRKEIIKSIIAESAIEHGFKLEWGTRTRTTWYILSMTREGLGQCVHFVEDSVFPGVLVVMGIYDEDCIFKFDINDEESYKNVIMEVKDILEKDGYKNLDARRMRASLKSTDLNYIAEKYSDLKESFCSRNNLDYRVVTIKESIDHIATSIRNIEGEEWNDIRDLFYEISGYYISVLLDIDGIEMNRNIIDEKTQSLEIRRTDNKYIYTYVIHGIFGDWRRGADVMDIKKTIVHDLNRLLTMNQLKSFGIEVEEWKRFNESLAKDEE